jgi:D-beta-D-heptose 7-phosphate kinase/D-beta-D-heptose 1-phosphate adenosyltransferase
MKNIERSSIKKIVAGLRSEGKKIVFTNGCFDILHIGHVRYLKESKGLGDVLIVGLNSDSSISRIKPGRPLTPERERAEILSSLSVVDFITIFDEDTPYELIREVQPDILVKGSDWAKKDIVGADIAKDVQTVPLTEGISTSVIVDRIQKLGKP